jgi:predicted RNA-binding Zn-ribbon protein involved in translation (DUF1610 family)
LIELLVFGITALIVLGSVAFAMVVVVASVAMPILLMRRLQSQMGEVRITMPPRSDGPTLVKRTTCRFCGSPKVTRSLSAYVYCDYCGELIDWDFQAALADRRSKLPGPAYEQLLARMRPRLEAARSAKDAKAYEAVQVEIWEAYAKACPAALSPRIGDAAWRKRWIAYTAAHTTACDLDPDCKALFDVQSAATAALQWDRSDLFSPKAVPHTFWPLLDAVSRYQRACASRSTAAGLLERHPDRPTEEMLVRIGTSAFAQGWIPFLSKADADALLDKTGLSGEYVKPEPMALKSGPCPSCAAPLQVVEGAHRVLCEACGHLAGVDGSSLPCHGCGTKVQLPSSGSLFKCPSCDAELRMMRWS